MPLDPTLQQTLETKIDAIKTKVVTRQNTYFANHGRYWQGVRTFSLNAVPDGTDTGFNAQLKPSDQTETWADFLGVDLPAKIPVSISIDTYDGPSGKGYTVTVLVAYNGKLWSRIWNVGNETWRAKTWFNTEMSA